MNLHGAATALVTPFLPDLKIDFDGLGRIIEHLITHKTDYLVALGTTGEVATLSREEKQAVIDYVVKTVNNRIPVVVGMGGNNTQAILEDFNFFNFSVVSAILSVSPYYNKPNQLGIINHYKILADNSPLPMIIYNVPGSTGINMTAKTQLELAKHANIIATKEASGNMEQIMEIIANKPSGFEVISGDDALTFPMMACGAVGVISVANHGVPASFNEMVHLANQGHWDKAKELHYKNLSLFNAIFEDGSPGGIKEILSELNLCGTSMRPPLWPVNEELAKRLRAMVKA